MRAILWLLLLSGLLGVTAPLYYFYVASSLPQLESEFDLERYLRQHIEGERMSYRLGRYSKDEGGIAFQRPDFAKLPQDLVAFYISGWRCPTFFQTPRESGLAWSGRVFAATVLGSSPGGDGRCEWELANQLAWAIHIRGGLRQSLAASRIHSFLQKDQLVAYALAAVPFERAVVGLEDATRVIFKKPLDSLRLEELAELELALPPFEFYKDLKVCRNAALIRQSRDTLLVRLARDGLIPEERARAALSQPVSCTRN